MNRYYKLMIFFVVNIVVLFPCRVFAYELSCDKESITYGETLSCSLVGDIFDYDKLSGTVVTDDILTCNLEFSNGLISSSNDPATFDLTGIPATSSLVTLTCKATDNVVATLNTQLSINNFLYHQKNSGIDEKSEIVRSDFIKIEPKAVESNNNSKPRDLSDASLRFKSLTSEQLDLTFSQFISEYSLSVLYEVEEVSFDYVLNDSTSSVRIEGDTKLHVGDNIIDIYITSSDSEKESCYTFYIERLARGKEIYYEESDATLQDMRIPGYSINFETNVFDYKIHLTSDVNSVNVIATTTYDGASISISDTNNLKNGDIIAVEVTSADETKVQIYKIKVTKDAPKKDYTMVIIIVVLSIAFIATTVSFIISAQRKKDDDPLLKLKKDKRKLNKGEKFDQSLVGEASINQEDVSLNEGASVNTLNLDASNTVTPIPTTTQPSNLNVVSDNKESIDLTNAVPPTPVQNLNGPMENNFTNQNTGVSNNNVAEDANTQNQSN